MTHLWSNVPLQLVKSLEWNELDQLPLECLHLLDSVHHQRRIGEYEGNISYAVRDQSTVLKSIIVSRSPMDDMERKSLQRIITICSAGRQKRQYFF